MLGGNIKIYGREACEKFESENGVYDLIFMGIRMPEMDGYEGTKCIRDMPFPIPLRFL